MAVALAEVIVASRRTDEGIRMGEEIEAIRKEGPFTQQQVADRLGLSLPTYLHYRRGYTKISPNNIKRWADALDYPVVKLAARLGILLPATSDAVGLRQELTALFPDASARELDGYVRDLATLPPADQRDIMDGLRDHILGRKAHLGLA